jgi:hypothetical protein
MTRVRLASHHPRIPLASADEAFCKVVAPRGDAWEPLAHRFCVRVAEYALTQPEQVAPDDLTDEDYSRFHLVLFGSILNNPAILRLYVRHRCFTDADYPGRGGVEIRSVANPLGTGRNVLLIGGTDFACVNEATIGFHRSFSQVTFEKDGILWLHPLNFCMSPTTPRWNPTAEEAEGLRRRLLENPEDAFHHLADYGLFHYQTGDSVWAEIITRALPSLRDTETASGLEKFVIAWTLIHWSAAFTDTFRVETDAWLEDVGSRLVERTTTPAVDVASFLNATAAHRIREHFRCLHGTDPFDRAPDALPDADALRAADGFRDWYALDVWMSRVFESERYDAIETRDLDGLSREAVATTDNLKIPVGEPRNHRHARNVLAKIAAFENDGRYVWFQRWMTTEDRRLDNARAGSADDVSRWYTGKFASDLIPREPETMPTVETVGLDATTRRFDGIAFRRGFDSASEYLFLSRTGSVHRMTWNGAVWFAGGSWTDAPATWIRASDLPEVGFCALDCGAYRRFVLWRHAEFILIVDRWTAATGKTLETTWSSPLPGDRQDDSWTVSYGFQALRLASADGTSLTRWNARNQAAKAVALTFDPNTQIRVSDDRWVRLGATTCHVGRFANGDAVVDCDALVFESGRLSLFGLRRVTVAGIPCVDATRAVDLSVGLPDGRGRLRVDGETAIRRSDRTGRVETRTYPPGWCEVEYGDVDWTDLMRPLVGDAPSV